jgi:hypothetical protein
MIKPIVIETPEDIVEAVIIQKAALVLLALYYELVNK